MMGGGVESCIDVRYYGYEDREEIFRSKVIDCYHDVVVRRFLQENYPDRIDLFPDAPVAVDLSMAEFSRWGDNT